MQKKEKMKNVTAMPRPSLNTGNNRFTSQSATHIVIMQIESAVPRICVGKISVDITNFNGPNEKAKNNKKEIMHNNMSQPSIFNKKQIPVKASARAAHSEPVMYNGRRPQLSTLAMAISVNNILAAPKITWYNNALLLTIPADCIMVGP